MKEFDKFAHDYKDILDKSLALSGEKGDYFADYKANFVRRRVGKNFSGKILDYGCGIGLLSDSLLKIFPGAKIDGFDDSGVSIDFVPDRLKKQGSFTSDFSRLKGDYDLIVLANVLHHIKAEQREGVIAGLKKMVRHNGKIIIFEHNPINPLTRKTVRNSPLDVGVVLLPYSETSIYIERAGFENVDVNYIVFFPKSFSALRFAEPFLTWLPLGAQYAAIGQVEKYA